MIKKLTIMATLITSVLFHFYCSGENESDDSENRYIGLESPGLIPELFAKEIIPVEDVQHCFPAFSPDGHEVYWMQYNMKLRSSVLMYMEYRNNSWSKPDTARFSVGFTDTAPVFSADGSRLFFVSRRPGGLGASDIWYIEKTGKGWSEPVNAGSQVNTELRESQPTFTRDGTMYFVRWTEGYEYGWVIYRSRLVDREYSEPEMLPAVINRKTIDYSPYISPDESYLIFASGREGRKSKETDLYISFRDRNDKWSEPVNMGDDINNGYTVTFPFVTYDGKYLFFNRFNDSGTDAFYWVDASIIDFFRPHDKK